MSTHHSWCRVVCRPACRCSSGLSAATSDESSEEGGGLLVELHQIRDAQGHIKENGLIDKRQATIRGELT